MQIKFLKMHGKYKMCEIKIMKYFLNYCKNMKILNIKFKNTY